MSIYRLKVLLSFALLAILFGQCATPTQPTGGPRDTTPPEVVETEPATGTTNFDQDQIRFEFSKYIDRNSFQDAFRMEPDVNLDYEISWRRRRATVEFNDPLPDTTTFIFTIGTDLQDTRNNNIAGPYQLALSTGPDIDQGRITATVRDAQTGEGLMGERVVLYRHPADLEESANYVGEADSAGVVRFNYLREGRYKAFWLDDRNRNRRWDREREDAQPFQADTLELDFAGELDAGTVFVTSEDTIPPVLQAVGMLSEVRMRLRFSKDVDFAQDAILSISHEDETFAADAIPLYVDGDNPNILLAESLNPLPDDQSYGIEMQGIEDLAGNAAESSVELFPGSDEADTTFARYVGQDTRHGIASDMPLIFRYAKLLDQTPEVLDSLTVIESQTTHESWPYAEVHDNLLYVYPEDEWQQGEDYEVRIWDDEILERRSIVPDILYEDQLGGLEVMIEEPVSDTTRYHLTLEDEMGVTERSETFTGDQFDVLRLPTGNYRLRVFEIRNDSQKWDPGSVDPYRPPARFFIQQDIPVERGLTGQVYVNWL